MSYFQCTQPFLRIPWFSRNYQTTKGKIPLTVISVNTLRPRQSGRIFADDIFKCIFLNENIWISIDISLKFIPNGQINNFPALVQIMAWRLPGDKPLSESMITNLLTHICVPRPQWAKRTNRSITKKQMDCRPLPNTLCLIGAVWLCRLRNMNHVNKPYLQPYHHDDCWRLVGVRASATTIMMLVGRPMRAPA